MTASPPLVRALRQPFWAVARPVPKAKGKPVLALPGDLAAAPCPAVPARDLPLSSHAPKVISPAPLVLPAPTGRSSPRGAVLVSIALHLGLLGGYAVFASTARPLIVPDLNTAEVSLISEAQFLAMSAPQPVLAMAAAPALATPALAAPSTPVLPVAAPMPEPASLASAMPTALPAAEPPPPMPEPMPEPVAQKPAAPAPKAIKPKGPAPVAEAPPETKPVTKTAKAEVPAKPVQKAAEPAAAPAPQPAAQSAAKSDPAASSGEAKALKADWGSKVRARINRKVALPADSAPGTVKVRLEIAASGALLAVGIAQSSGQAALDAAALEAVKSAAPFARAPKGLSEPSYSFSLPITFKN
jgi:protein TonB